MFLISVWILWDPGEEVQSSLKDTLRSSLNEAKCHPSPLSVHRRAQPYILGPAALTGSRFIYMQQQSTMMKTHLIKLEKETSSW